MVKNLLLLALIFTFSACQTSEISDIIPNEGTSYLSGTFIAQANGSISFIDRFNGKVSDNIFKNANNDAAAGSGDLVLKLTDTHLWIWSKNENEIILAQPDFMTEVRRFSIPENSIDLLIQDEATAFLTIDSPLGATDFITKIDSSGNQTTIYGLSNQTGPAVQTSNSRMYAPNGAGTQLDSTVTYINLSADTIIGTLTLPAPNPAEGVVINNRAWFLCTGNVTSSGALVEVNGATVSAFPVAIPAGGSDLRASQDNAFLLYKLNGQIYRQAVEDITRNTNVFIDKDCAFSAIDPITGEYYCATNEDGGKIFRYNVNSGALLTSFTTEGRARGLAFKEN